MNEESLQKKRKRNNVTQNVPPKTQLQRKEKEVSNFIIFMLA